MEKIKAIMNDNLDYRRDSEADEPLSARGIITFTDDFTEALQLQYEAFN